MSPTGAMSPSGADSPNRRLRGAIPRWIGFAVLVAVAVAAPWLPVVRTADLGLLDTQFRALRVMAPDPAAGPVAVVGIDEDTYKAFPEPFALWHEHFGRLFEALAAAGPRVVGLDINLPDRSFNFLVAGLDQKLLRGLVRLKRAAPVVLGVTVDAAGRTRPVYPPFLSVAGPDGHAYVLWRQDADRVVRSFRPEIGDGARKVPTLVATMAKHLGLEPTGGLIDFTVGAPFGYVPLHRVIEWLDRGDTAALRAAFAGKAVLVGSVLPFEDRHYQPVNLAGWEDNDNFVPGVLIHAQALRALMGPGLVATLPGWVPLALAVAMAGLWWLARRPWLAGGLVVLVAAALVGGSTVLLERGTWLPVAAALATAVLAAGARVAWEAVLQVMERQRLRRSFGGYVSPQVMEEILSGHLEPGLHGQRRRICLMFSDVRSFTTLSEHLAPEEVVGILNRYFEQMTAAIQDNGGTVDKFMGDGIMAFFGAPRPMDDPAAAGFRAAGEMLRRLEALNRRFEAEGRQPLRIGIGLHVGDAVVGNMGSERRNEYTAIGDVVNTASRLEGLTKQAGYPVVVSRVVAEALAAEASFVHLGDMPVKGRAPVDVYGWRPDGVGAGQGEAAERGEPGPAASGQEVRQ